MADECVADAHNCETQDDVSPAIDEAQDAVCDSSAQQLEDGEPAPVEPATNRVPPHIPLLPPEDCIAITADKGVLKKVLEPGEPDSTKPALHARCLIHYIGYLMSNGEKFMDTRMDSETGEPVVVVAGRTASAQETGLCQAAATMCRGERSLVYITDPSYGYGALGSFSFPCVPPHSQLVYEVEMVNWEDIQDDDNDTGRVSLLYEERVERAERRRLAGNQLYKEGSYKDALAKYALALSYLDEDFMYQLEGHYLDKAEKVKLQIHLNMAATQLKTGDYNTAIYNCGQVLQLEENNIKALYRRGRARHKLGRTEEAEQDLVAASKQCTSPEDKDLLPEILKELAVVRAAKAEEKRATEKFWGGKLAPKPGAKPASASASGSGGPNAGAPPAAAAATAGCASTSGATAAAGSSGAKGHESKGTTAGDASGAGPGPTKRGAGTGAGKAVTGSAKAPAAKPAKRSRARFSWLWWERLMAPILVVLAWLSQLLASLKVRLGLSKARVPQRAVRTAGGMRKSS